MQALTQALLLERQRPKPEDPLRALPAQPPRPWPVRLLSTGALCSGEPDSIGASGAELALCALATLAGGLVRLPGGGGGVDGGVAAFAG